MQAELDKVSTLLNKAADSFQSKSDDDPCTHLSEAAAILERMIADASAETPLPSRARTAAA